MFLGCFIGWKSRPISAEKKVVVVTMFGQREVVVNQDSRVVQFKRCYHDGAW